MDVESHRLSCPSCGATYRYKSDKIDESGYVECQNCVKRFSAYGGTDEWLSGPHDDTDAIKPSIQFLSERVEGSRISCPNCGSKYVYTNEHGLQSGMVKCQNCGSKIEAVGENVLIVKEPTGAQTQTGSNAEWVIVILVLLFLPLIIAIPLVLCFGCYKMIQGREQTYHDSKVVRRGTEGPGLG